MSTEVATPQARQRVCSGERHYSGILVCAARGALERCRVEVEAIDGIEVHLVYPESERLIVVQETETARQQEEGLQRLQGLPTVLSAALVEHRVESQG